MTGKNRFVAAAMRLFFGACTPALYALLRTKPLKPGKAVFVEYRRDALPDSLELIFAEMRSRGFDCKLHLLRQGFVSSAEFMKNCLSLVADIADAKYIVVCEGGKVFSRAALRGETAVLQTWHACGAFKRFGFSAASENSPALSDLKYYMPYNARYCSVSSPELISLYREAFGTREGNNIEIRADGVSRTDIYFTSGMKELARKELSELVPGSACKRAILYAPTFRGESSEAKAPELPELRVLKELLGEGFVFLIKQHPIAKERPEIPEDCRGFAFDVSDAMSVENAMMAADCCVTDYSSIVFEYSLLDRPMFFFTPDEDEYETGRGFFYPLSEFCPGPRLKNAEQLADAILKLDDCDMKLIKDFRERFMSSCDGKSTKRIVDRLLEIGGGKGARA